jgi:ABC-type histidine transport system ATPase subunit
VAGSAAGTQGGTAAADVEDVPQELELLKGINAFAVPGNLVALMGGSGVSGCVWYLRLLTASLRLRYLGFAAS